MWFKGMGRLATLNPQCRGKECPHPSSQNYLWAPPQLGWYGQVSRYSTGPVDTGCGMRWWGRFKWENTHPSLFSSLKINSILVLSVKRDPEIHLVGLLSVWILFYWLCGWWEFEQLQRLQTSRAHLGCIINGRRIQWDLRVWGTNEVPHVRRRLILYMWRSRSQSEAAQTGCPLCF